MQSPKNYTNHLINESSPYLLQHAHNPVDWYPWGDEAFAKAAAEDKAVMISIGYSACHWCHVMEHESFEDVATAAVMNEHFVNIKVDMEERPDVDQIYMTFVQLTTGRGGWPMTVFLTPEKLPFFGGTYFPPVSRYNMPSFQQVLLSVSDAYKNKREDLMHSANDLLGEMRRVGIAEFAPQGLTTGQLDSAFQSFVRTFDAKNGGFGGAPKFPPAMSLEFLLRYYKRTGNENALEMVKFTAGKMAEGGIYDQLGGGFHRYAVDSIWLVPHFEKMLYDNAQLIRVYLHLYQIARSAEKNPVAAAAGIDSEFYKRVAVETLEYVKREMLDAAGGFYSTQDADSEGVEGKFFVWTPAEIAAVVGEEDAKVFNFYYDVSEEGNFEDQNILNVIDERAFTGGDATVTERASGQPKSTLLNSRVSARSGAAYKLEISEVELDEILERSRKKLFDEREKRIKPFRDEKVLTAWNGLMLAAFAEAAAVLDSEDYLNVAKSNADFIIENLQKDGRLLRTWKDGKAKLNAYIEDYANVADGLIELFQVSGEVKYLSEAKRLADLMITEFWDEENGGFYFTSNDHEELLVRNKDFYDNATPAGNSVAADVLQKLAKLLGDDKYERFASTVLRLIAPQISRHPQGFGRALSAIEFNLAAVKEIVIIGEKGNELEREVWSEFLPNKVVVLSGGTDDGTIPLIAERKIVDGKATAYVCENFVCQRPVTSVVELREQF